ncbi:TPA: RNA polymerase sigma factor WhiG, partial [Candidatus Woesearchaeota archaeon]|nr:RNA polymerase sigma factor WhiG [Candidatus Woesearchaeota archaeon]
DLYYFSDLNLREIGKILGVCEARVSQIHTRALKELRQTWSVQEL